MEEKQNLAIGRLTKKLNALRETLRTDERALLDTMMQQTFPEAEGHALKPASKTAVKPAVSPEVEGHAVKPVKIEGKIASEE